jgi:hypothetical protein
MTTKEILTATKKMTFNQAVTFIKNIGLELTLSENMPFLVSYEIKNNNQISRISIYMKTLECKMADVKFSFLY